MSQTTYTIDQPAGSVGFIADASFILDIESYVNAANLVTYGCVVTRGAATDLIVHPDAAAEITDEKLVRGIVAADPSMPSKEDGLVANYPVGSVVNVMRKGRVWVIAENAITEGTSTVNVRFLAGAGGTQLGALRGASVVSETAVLPKSKWKSSTSTTGQLAIIEIDL